MGKFKKIVKKVGKAVKKAANWAVEGGALDKDAGLKGVEKKAAADSEKQRQDAEALLAANPFQVSQPIKDAYAKSQDASAQSQAALEKAQQAYSTNPNDYKVGNALQSAYDTSKSNYDQASSGYNADVNSYQGTKEQQEAYAQSKKDLGVADQELKNAKGVGRKSAIQSLMEAAADKSLSNNLGAVNRTAQSSNDALLGASQAYNQNQGDYIDAAIEGVESNKADRNFYATQRGQAQGNYFNQGNVLGQTKLQQQEMALNNKNTAMAAYLNQGQAVNASQLQQQGMAQNDVQFATQTNQNALSQLYQNAGVLGDQENMAWDMNTYQPYLQKMQFAQDLNSGAMNAGIQRANNKAQIVSAVTGVATGLAGAVGRAQK